MTLHTQMRPEPRSLTRCLRLTAGATCVGLLLAVPTQAAVFNTVGVYDEPTQTNQVDRNASGNALASLSGNDVLGFTAGVAAAFATEMGGVIDFGSTTQSGITPIDAVYGVGQSKNLNITSSAAVNTITASPNVTPISGSRLAIAAASATRTLTFTFGDITNVSDGSVVAGEFVSQVGLTILSRVSSNFPANITLTANYSGGGSEELTALFASANATEDTFYGFTAPTGQSVSSLTIFSDPTSSTVGATSDVRAVFDDLGFITVIPEPSAVLGGMAMGGLSLLRRRRN